MEAKQIIICGAAAFAMLGLGAKDARAQFYKGRTLNVIINYGAGGNTDVQGRTLMRYLEKYIPGQPRVVVRNMPGAGGAVGANFMNKGAKRDGTFMGVFTTPWMHEVANSGALTDSLSKLVYIGAIGQQQVAHVRKDIGGGIETVADFLKVKEKFKSAGHAPTSSKDVSIRITLRMLGMNHEHVVGFKSAGPIRRALMQNEVQYTEDSLAGYYGGVVPNLIEKGISIPLWHNGIINKDGLMDRADSVPEGLMTFSEVYQLKYGKDSRPKGLDWELYTKITNARQFLRTIVMPPGAPKEAVDEMRGAWLKTVEDKEYLAEYLKKNKSPLKWRAGEDVQKNIEETLSVSPELREHIQELVSAK